MYRLITLITFLLIASSAFGQNRSPHQNFVMQFGEDLQLTEQQISQIVALQLERRSAMQKQRRSPRQGEARRGQPQNEQRIGQTRGDQRASQEGRFSEDREEHHNQIMSILTDTQKAQLIELRKQRANQAHNYRTIKHAEMIKKADLSRSKSRDVQRILDAHSKSMLDLQLARIESGTMGSDQQARRAANAETHNKLREMLTVAEYEALGFGLGNRQNFEGRGQQRSGFNRR